MATAVGAVARPDDPPHLKIAIARLGLKEVAGPGDNPDVVAMFARVGRPDVRHDETSWCAAFVGSCLVEAGVPLAKLPPKEDRLMARSYLDFGRKVSEPERGAIVVFWRGSPSAWTGHVALFLRYVTIDGRRYVEVIGGNQANAVTIARFPVGQVLGYRRADPSWMVAPAASNAPDLSHGQVATPAVESEMGYTYAALKAEYVRRWEKMIIDAGEIDEALAAARLILRGKSRYRAVEAINGTPWGWIGLAHYREASCDFSGVLHNGQHIIGTGRKTTEEPIGRGPFSSWEEAAVDALRIKKLSGSLPWSITYTTFKLEVFNGMGYRSNHKPSAYLWAGTNQYEGGKYVKDHVFDPHAMDGQLGVCPVMLALMHLDPDANFGTVDVALPPFPGAGAPSASARTGPAPSATPRMSVREIQSALTSMGFSVGPDGIDGEMGPNTEDAIRAFQGSQGLDEDGIAGPETMGALRAAVAAHQTIAVDAPAAAPNLTRDEVLALQRLLIDKGFPEVGLIDGEYGASTKGAVSAFQAAVDLPTTGVFDKTTAAELAVYPGRKVGAERASVTAKELRKAGDPVAKESFLQRIAGSLGLGGLGIAGFGQYFAPVRDGIASLQAMFADIPSWVWLVGGALALFWLIRSAGVSSQARVAAVRSGVDRGGFSPTEG